MKNYLTTNLYEASFLLTRGFNFISKDKINHKTALVFSESDELNETIIAYYSGETASAKALFDSYRTLKDFVFSDRR